MSENDEPRGSGWEDLFAPLADDTAAGTTSPEFTESAATILAPAPEAPLLDPDVAESAPVPAAQASGAFDPAALYSALQEDLAAEAPVSGTSQPTESAGPAEAATAAEAPAPVDVSTGLTRRELREQRAAGGDSGPIPVATEPPAQPEPPFQPESAATPEALEETAPTQGVPPIPPAAFPAGPAFPPAASVPADSAFAASQAAAGSGFAPAPSFPPAAPSFPPAEPEAPAAAQPEFADGSVPAMQHAADVPQHAVPEQAPDASIDLDAPRLPEPFAVPAPEPVPWDPAPELQPDTVVQPGAAQPGTTSAPEIELPPTVAMPLAEPVVVPTVPVSYDAVAAGEPPAVPPVDGGFPMALIPPPPGRRGGVGLRWLAWFIPVVLVVAAVVTGGVYVWTHYEDKVRQVLGMETPSDYSGTGDGEPVVVTIEQGASGSDIALALYQAGVTMTWKSFNDLANSLAHSTDCANPDPTNGCWPVIQFGNYNLQKQMSAKSALAALQDPANKVTNNLVIPEGSSLKKVLQIISATTGISIDELNTAAANPAQFGAANPANSLEGYLFPDTYQLTGTETATSILQRLVTETFQKLDALGVKPEDRHAFLTGASIVQKESGPVPGDAAKVARVFQNRLAQNMKLQSDATVAYGAGNTTSIWNSSAQLSDANNPYNTYVHPGLPIGPIAAPGAVALDAWAHPADGDWLFFVPVNLKTGETHFSTTDAEHEQYVQQLVQWCEASAENAAYCK